MHGYRVDVRVHGQPTWASLCEVKGTLPFNGHGYGSGAVTSIDGELWVAPAPIRPSEGTPGGAPDNDANDRDAWLPLYFAQWARRAWCSRIPRCRRSPRAGVPIR